MESMVYLAVIGLLFLAFGAAARRLMKPTESDGITPAFYWTGGVVLYIAAVVAILAFVTTARARDAGQWDGADPSIRQWYETLMQPDVPTSSCCGAADAYFCDDYRSEGGKALCTISDDRPDEPRHRPHIDIGTVIEIPQHKLKFDRGNPTGHSVVFLSRERYVYCFVQGGGV